MPGNNPFQKPLATIACNFAKEAHYTQNYGNQPYFKHLVAVVSHSSRLVARQIGVGHPVAEIIFATAYLHDVIEDTGADEAILREVFTKAGLSVEEFEPVIKAVKLLSKNLCPPGEFYLERVMTCPVAHLVKIADTLSNLTESVRNNDTQRVTKYAEQLRILHINPIGSFAHVV